LQPIRSTLLIALTLATPPLVAQAAPTARAVVGHVTVELLAENKSFKPGAKAAIGIELRHEPGWHTYWINPGDSGLPTRVDWSLPENYRAGEIEWPAPQRFELGGLYNFGYDTVVVLPVTLDVPLSAPLNSAAALAVKAKWLVCSHEICIPGAATLELTVPVSSNEPLANERAAKTFAQARARTPIIAAWRGEAQMLADRVHIELRGKNLPGAAGLDAFPVATKLLNSTPPRIASDGAKLTLEAQKSDYFEKTPPALQLVLTHKDSGEQIRAWQVEVPVSTTHKLSAVK